MKTTKEIYQHFYKILRVATRVESGAFMSIPARPDHDSDIIVSEAIAELGALRERVKELEEALDDALGAMEQVGVDVSGFPSHPRSTLEGAMDACLRLCVDPTIKRLRAALLTPDAGTANEG